jgi:pentatricopeptide repeat protein
VDQLAEALVRILQMTPKASQEYIATNRFILVSALVQAGRLDEAETMFESLPRSSSEWVSFYRRSAGRALKNAGRLATPTAESSVEQDAEPTEVPVTKTEPSAALMGSAGNDVTASTNIGPSPSQASRPEGSLPVRPRRTDWGLLAVCGTASVMILASLALRMFRRQTAL